MSKTVDLTPKAEKISDEMLAKLQKAVSGINGLQFEIGQVEIRKHELLHRYAMAQDKTQVLKAELEKEYGTSDVNLTDGTINYAEGDEKQ